MAPKKGKNENSAQPTRKSARLVAQKEHAGKLVKIPSMIRNVKVIEIPLVTKDDVPPTLSQEDKMNLTISTTSIRKQEGRRKVPPRRYHLEGHLPRRTNTIMLAPATVPAPVRPLLFSKRNNRPRPEDEPYKEAIRNATNFAELEAALDAIPDHVPIPTSLPRAPYTGREIANMVRTRPTNFLLLPSGFRVRAKYQDIYDEIAEQQEITTAPASPAASVQKYMTI